MWRGTITIFLLAVGLLSVPALAEPGAPAPTSSVAPAPVPGEEAVFMRLLSPCCYQQTLDVHDSPISTELRAEIRQRLRAGESPEAIEDSMVARYGERIVALSREDPLDTVSVVLAIMALAVGIVLIGFVRRWVRASGLEPDEAIADASDDDRYERRLDAELDALDDA